MESWIETKNLVLWRLQGTYSFSKSTKEIFSLPGALHPPSMLSTMDHSQAFHINFIHLSATFFYFKLTDIFILFNIIVHMFVENVVWRIQYCQICIRSIYLSVDPIVQGLWFISGFP